MKGWGQQRGVAAASAKVQGKKHMNGACKNFFFIVNSSVLKLPW